MNLFPGKKQNLWHWDYSPQLLDYQYLQIIRYRIKEMLLHRQRDSNLLIGLMDKNRWEVLQKHKINNKKTGKQTEFAKPKLLLTLFLTEHIYSPSQIIITRYDDSCKFLIKK